MNPKPTILLLAISALFLVSDIDAAETTTVAKMLAAAQGDPKASRETLPLEREWIGDIKDDEGKIERLRLEKGGIRNGEITLQRTYPNGGYTSSDAPVYVKSIPDNEKLRSCTTVEEIKKLLNAGQPGMDGWGSPNEMHGSHSWVCFSPTSADRLTYIHVFAHTSWNKEQQAKKIKLVDKLLIQRGELRPADPGDPKEKALYLSGADKFAAEQKAKAQERQRFPKPLQALVAVDEHPDDPDLKHLSAAIQAIRDNPDPKLFTQLVQELHEGTLSISSLLKHILLNEGNLLKLKPWDPKKEAIAVNACIDALPLAKEGAADDLVETLLRVCGGGKIEIESDDGGSRIEVKLTKDGHELSIEGASDPLPLEQAKGELRRLYEKSREKKGGAGQPADR